MDHFYKDYAIERIHIGKPDSIWVQPGDYRLQIGMLTPQDPAAKKWVIRYEGDSLVLPIDRTAERQFAVIENLKERDYTLLVHTSDGLGNTSLPMELSAPVFGDNYRASIKERVLSHSVIFQDSIGLVWKTMSDASTLFGSEIEFTDLSGQKKKTLVGISDVSVFQGADPSKPISVKTVFRPHVNAFEYFYTDAVTVDLLATKLNMITLKSSAWTDAEYIDFNFIRVFQEAVVQKPKGRDIDLAYTLGSGSRSNFFVMDGAEFGAFSQDWQSLINSWSVRNSGKLKLNRGAAALALYDGLDELNRSQMVAAFDNSVSAAQNRIFNLLVGDIILLKSTDRDIYVAMKVLAVPPAASGVYGKLEMELKISRP
ncbi:DUF4998 domain-containing protein [Sphingobacterium faecale]|uniref:Uncharacterized protein n=1 Tax=Sphingobacterium faecale TaxID=2803775 RepID=A0ABS1R7X2_9SPHI|nr:DUF4998 domain-containing protein [Sphingobacterium faecale]MBL1410787.1 hypothetical protein [Sphingobacterium faecale]